MTTKPKQQMLFDVSSSIFGVNGTFSPNHRQSIHRWYPYIEGFSSEFVNGLMAEFGSENCRIYDPFAGTGTTVTTAAFRESLPYYSEINPVMRLIIECKTNGLRVVARKRKQLREYFGNLLEYARANLLSADDAKQVLQDAFGEREYFKSRRLVEIVTLKLTVTNFDCGSPIFRDFARLALASIAVPSSEMKRAADLRYRHPKECLTDNYSPFDAFEQKCEQVLDDIDPSFADLPAVECLSPSALDLPKRAGFIDLLITSPPYVNGTNYFRNTKIELWLAGLLERESELAGFTDIAMAAGINNISKRGRTPQVIECVEEVATKLDDVAYDKRIPELVRRYFSDSQVWIKNAHTLLKPGGHALIDIGDSRYAGVHVPADALLAAISEAVGFDVVETRSIRSRKSKDGEAAKQVLIVLKKPQLNSQAVLLSTLTSTADEFLTEAISFGRQLPHLEPPYSSRNWGHGLHSLCSYQGKLKPAIAHFLVNRFTLVGQRVLDPLSGCGTIPLEAFLQGREPLANDLQELAFILSSAKVQRGDTEAALRVSEDVLKFVDDEWQNESASAYSDFGFNGKLPEYFHDRTFKEVLACRRFMQLNPCVSWEKAIVYSSVLHILHGNRPYALSRRSHPVTPFKPTGESSYRALKSRLLEKLNRSLKLEIPQYARPGKASLGAFSDLRFRGTIDAIITSPPFAESTRFYSTNWMRLWMAGWESSDFASRKEMFLERKQKKSLDIYKEFFACCQRWLVPGGRLILHLGKTAKCDMSKELSARIPKEFELVYQFDEDVAGREKFGLRDQGATTSHQYLFLRLK
jgi:tRNA G10  N-methylase Trm11